MTVNNAKGDLIARSIALGLGVPTFDTLASGPPHERNFRVTVLVGGQEMGLGEARTKKEAERAAAEQALGKLSSTPTTSVTAITEPSSPWPIYAQVLAQSIDAALELAPEDASLEDIQHEAAQFYKGLLAELGHGPEREA